MGAAAKLHPAARGCNTATVPQQVTPYLLYEDTNAAVDWLTRVFGFTEVLRATNDDGAVTHAELELEGGAVFLGWPGPDYRGPKSLGTTTVGIHVYVDDVDAHFARAKAEGAEIAAEPTLTPYGDRRYDCDDLEGHSWFFATRVEEKAPEDWGAVRPE
jgi:PhnB protein